MDKDNVTHCLSAPNHTALYKKFNHKFQVLNLDRRTPRGQMVKTGKSTLVNFGVPLDEA